MNDEFQRKRRKAIELLRGTGISPRNFLPPTSPVLWRIGIVVPRPHFMRFVSVLLLTGLPFGFSALGFAIASMETSPVTGGAMVAVFLAATIGFGGVIGLYHRIGRLRHRLPAWKDL